jgi:Zn-dependent protease with chaperone function
VLLFLALLFVPGVYFILLISAAIPLAIWFWLVEATSHLSNASSSNQTLEKLVGFGALIATYACLRGIWKSFFRNPRFELALPVDLRKETKLRAFINSVCRALGTQPPDSVILHAQPNFFVQNGKLQTLNGIVKGKILALGLPVLTGLFVNELRAILAHEFAHFTGKDTLYSSVVLPVYVGTRSSITRLRSELRSNSDDIGEAFLGLMMKAPMLPPYAMLVGYLKLFQLLDLFVSRIRERRADTIAASFCGSETFSRGLRKTVRLSRSFDSLSKDQIIDLLKDDKAFINYYATFRDLLPQVWQYSDQFESDALLENQKAFSSHPTLRARLAYLPDVPDAFSDADDCTSLFSDLEPFETTLTDNYTQYIAYQFAHEVEERKLQSRQVALRSMKPLKPVRVASVKCPHCFMRTYPDLKRCHICGKRLTSIFDFLYR